MKKYTTPKFDILEIKMEDVLKMSNAGDFYEDQGKPELHSAGIEVNNEDF